MANRKLSTHWTFDKDGRRYGTTSWRHYWQVAIAREARKLEALVRILPRQ
jgi:hypothetical protein